MKYYAQIGEREFVIDIESDGVLLDGERIDVDMQRSGVSELYSMLMGGRSHELLIEAQRYSYDITLHGDLMRVQVEDERSRRLSATRKLAVAEGESAIVAPIPGLVVKVLVSEGELVAIDQPVILLEAMKMENELRAPREGRIKQVKVAAGQRVEQNAALLVLE